jgi:hypothetical protein
MSLILILGAKSADILRMNQRKKKSYIDFLKEKTPFLEIVETALLDPSRPLFYFMVWIANNN